MYRIVIIQLKWITQQPQNQQKTDKIVFAVHIILSLRSKPSIIKQFQNMPFEIIRSLDVIDNTILEFIFFVVGFLIIAAKPIISDGFHVFEVTFLKRLFNLIHDAVGLGICAFNIVHT